MKPRLPLDIASLDGHITSPFGPRGDVIHQGLDLSKVPLYSPVYSIDEGVVDVCDVTGNTTAGKWLRIKHEGFLTRCLHLNSIIVKPGQLVREGQMIGTMGYTGSVIPAGPQGAHLHFEIIIGGQRVDPEPYLRGTQLLPSVATIELDGDVLLYGKLSGGTAYVEGKPIRELAAKLGCVVDDWAPETRTVILKSTWSQQVADIRAHVGQAIDLLKTI